VSTGPVPLYLILDSVPDVRALAVDIKWVPNNAAGACYYLVPADSVSSGCGSTAYLDRPGVFDGDSGYTWQIRFDGPGRGCVEYLVAAEQCENRSASFCLMSVKTMDSDSVIDELTILGGATILGGDSTGCPVVVADIYPHVAVLGRENTFTVCGRDFSSETDVSLATGDVVVSASALAVIGDSAATLEAFMPPDLAGVLDVVVSTTTSSDTLRRRVALVDSMSGLAPVWDLAITEVDGVSRASVETNEFTNPAYRRVFPMPDVILRKVIDDVVVYRDHVAHSLDIQAALLEIDADGRPAVTLPEYVSNACLSVDPDGPRTALLLPSPAVSAASMPAQWSSRTTALAASQLKDETVLEWEQAPDGAWYVAHTPTRTLVIEGGKSQALRELPARSFYGVFSTDASRFAAVLKSDSAVRWFVVDRLGAVVREGEPVVGEVSQLRLSADGRVLTFQRQRAAEGTATTVAVDLATGGETLLAVPDGVRYYSADGKTMLVLVTYPGALYLFDVGDPLAPIQLASAAPSPGWRLVTAAVAPDGALAAVQMVEDEDNPRGDLTRVVAFDRSLALKTVVARRLTTRGLQFQGALLFVGIQRHPIPVWLTLVSTERIQAFDLGGL
jgi:hypothetical protein